LVAPIGEALSDRVIAATHELRPRIRHLTSTSTQAYEAAEQICGADADTLQSLLDKNLLERRDSERGSRYWMLETIRDYALERLAEGGEEEETRRRHAEHFAAFAESAEVAVLHSEGQAAWVERVEAEHDNLPGALAWSHGVGDVQLEL